MVYHTGKNLLTPLPILLFIISQFVPKLYSTISFRYFLTFREHTFFNGLTITVRSYAIPTMLIYPIVFLYIFLGCLQRPMWCIVSQIQEEWLFFFVLFMKKRNGLVCNLICQIAAFR